MTAETTLTMRPIAPTFGAEVADMPVNGDVVPELLAQFVSLLHRYRVLVVPELSLDPADLVAFSERFGPLEIHSRFENTLPAHREVFCVGNVSRDGMTASFSRGVEQWHADSSYREVPSDASLLYGEIVPETGGDTWFADATAAYRTLDPAVRRRIDGLYAVHALETLRQWGQRHNPERAQDIDAQAARFPPVRQPLVRTHPATGRQSLFLSAHAGTIVGWPVPEARAFLRDLTEHATQKPFTYSHKWRRHDLVMWDNRTTMHRVTRFDETLVRDMRRTTVAGP